jgi:hypothetical protein
MPAGPSLSHSGTRRPGTSSTASGTNPCTIFCYDTSTLQPSFRTSSRAPAPCSPPFSSLLRHTSSSWLWLPKRSGAVDPTSSLLPLPCVMLTMTTKHGRMYLFTLQLIQIPLIAVGRTSVIKRSSYLGNMVFWLGLYAGFPMLCVAYVLY